MTNKHIILGEQNTMSSIAFDNAIFLLCIQLLLKIMNKARYNTLL